MTTEKKTGLELLREPFPAHQINYLVKGGAKLAFVGHAALTDRLLTVDPNWNWEFVATGPDGYPVIDENGGMWIRLTVCGVTRLGYGDAQGKTGGNAMKERIGDALRNAAMRFGAALDLWHKGELHLNEPETLDDLQIESVKKAAAESGVTVEQVCVVGKVDSLDEIEVARLDNLLSWIRKQKKEAA